MNSNQNIALILVILLVLKLDKFKEVKQGQSLNIQYLKEFQKLF